MSDVLDRIDDALTFYSIGLGEEITVPVEKQVPLVWAPPGYQSLYAAAAAYERAAAQIAASFAQVIEETDGFLRTLRGLGVTVKSLRRVCISTRREERIARRARRRELRRWTRNHYVGSRSHIGVIAVVFDETRNWPTPAISHTRRDTPADLGHTGGTE